MHTKLFLKLISNHNGLSEEYFDGKCIILNHYNIFYELFYTKLFETIEINFRKIKKTVYNIYEQSRISCIDIKTICALARTQLAETLSNVVNLNKCLVTEYQ